MKKPVNTFGLLLATLVALGGCDLYFGHHDSGGTWNYCGSDGYYQCQGDNCTWVGATCPAGSGSGSGATGSQCTSSTQCAAGCYCQNGTCEEGGFCTTDSDCGAGYHCDTSRSSCEPNPPPTTCNYDNQCPQGQYCSPTNNQCTTTCVCTNDQQAIAGGFGWCDTTRDTCLPGQNPAGTCAGTPASTCTTLEPVCPSGQVPLLIDGCFNGLCQAFASCNLPPVCEHINDETDCLGRADCSGTYTGIDCTKPDGSACHSGDVNCTCASFQFATCVTRPI